MVFLVPLVGDFSSNLWSRLELGASIIKEKQKVEQTYFLLFFYSMIAC